MAGLASDLGEEGMSEVDDSQNKKDEMTKSM